MVDKDFNPSEMLESLRQRLYQLDQERDALDNQMSELNEKRVETEKQIGNVKAVIERMLPLVGIAPGPDDCSALGFTDAIRHVFMLANEWLSPKDIRERLAENKFDLSEYANPMASIYTILARMKDSNEIEYKKEGNNVFYRRNLTPVEEEWGPEAEDFVATRKKR